MQSDKQQSVEQKQPWGKILSTKSGKADKRTKIAKALIQQGEGIDFFRKK